MNDRPSERHRVPDGIAEATVEAVGKLTEALETTERARGHLYSFHQLTGSADLALGARLLMALRQGDIIALPGDRPRAGMRAVALPFTVGGDDEAKTLTALFDDTIARLLKGAQ